uniref:FCH domain only protein 2 n=1 Tax=Steinernema glaseri TaxID=37863 RepID=A0A1I7YQY1_9BILA
MVAVNYTDHFWGDKHVGYHALYENLKHGETVVQELNQFLKERILFEDETLKFYNKACHRSSVFAQSNGSFADSWRVTKGTMELMVEIQTSLLKNLNDLAKDITKYHSDLAKSRKLTKQQDVADAVNIMQTTTTCLQKAKETYTQRCAELERLHKESASQKEISKCEAKVIKARDEYKQYVEKHTKVRENFEDKMVKAMKTFQVHDEAHLIQVRNFFTHFTRSIEDGYKAAAQVFAQYREAMQVVNIEELMNKFVEEKGTGSERPEPVEFEENEIAAELPASIISSSNSAPSSSNSSAIVPNMGPVTAPSVNDLLSLDTAWGVNTSTISDSASTVGGNATSSVIDLSAAAPKSPSGSDSSVTNNLPFSGQFSTSLGRQKLSLWLPKKNKKSQSSLSVNEGPVDFSQSHNETSFAGEGSPVCLSVLRGFDDKPTVCSFTSNFAPQDKRGDNEYSSLEKRTEEPVGKQDGLLEVAEDSQFCSAEDMNSSGVGKKSEAAARGQQTNSSASFTRTQSSSSLLKTVLEGRMIKKTMAPTFMLTKNCSDGCMKLPSAQHRPPKLSERNLSLIETFRRIDKLCAPEVERVRRSRATCRSCTTHALSRRRVESAPESFMKKTYDRFLKKRHRKSKKSLSELHSGEVKERIQFDDAKSVASSCKSDEKSVSLFSSSLDASGFLGNGPVHLMDMPIEPIPPEIPESTTKKETSAEPQVDEEGYTIRKETENRIDDGSAWSSDSSEDESDLQASKIRQLNIKPLNESTPKLNASVDELRSVIGSIQLQSTLNRSSTFDTDPWSSTAAPFSQSLNAASIRSIRPCLTGDEHLRRKYTDSDFGSSGQLPFSQSTTGAGISRARPRSNTPTFSASAIGLHFPNQAVSSSNNGAPANVFVAPRRGSNAGDNFAFGRSDSVNSLGQSAPTFDSPFSVSQSNLLKSAATINEQRVPIGIAQKEYSHAWFKGADFTQATLKVMGTIVLSFPSTVIALLTDIHSDVEPLKFSLRNAMKVKSIVPNKQLVLPTLNSTPSEIHKFTVDRLGLANWLIEQRRKNPDASFHNVDIIRYELESPSAPPLYFTSYRKLEPTHTDLRVDYRLNTDDNGLDAALLNVTFTTKVTGNVTSVTSDPTAKWSDSEKTLSWTMTEITRHGDCSGSLKARVHLADGPSNPEKTFVQFETNDASISGASVHLESDDTYHLSLVRRKVVSGKYFCEPEVRK